LTRAAVDYFVLDSIANDLESLEDVLRLLNHESIGWREFNGGKAYERVAVVAALTRCVRDGLVIVYTLGESDKALSKLPPGVLPIVSFDECWFGISEPGRLIHANWDPGLGTSA